MMRDDLGGKSEGDNERWDLLVHANILTRAETERIFAFSAPSLESADGVRAI